MPTKVFSKQLRKPSGFIGRHVMTKIFTEGNAELNKFVMECLGLQENDHVLEIGFGPGKLIYDIAATVKDGKVDGIDFSDTMLKAASKLNKAFIAKEKVSLHKGDCSSLPYVDNTFEKVCSVNTLYFWDTPETNLSEIYRTLKPGGQLIIGFRDAQQLNELKIDKNIFTTYSKDEVITLLEKTGFKEVAIKEKDGKFLTSNCAVAHK